VARKIPLPPAPLAPFLGREGTPSACFCRKLVCVVQDRCGDGLAGLLVWRSLRGLFKPLCFTDRATQTIQGRLWRIRFRGSCMARGPREQGGSRARAPLRDAKQRARGRTPCKTQTSEFKTDGQEPSAWFYQSNKRAAQPRKGLHVSRITKPFPQRSCTLPTNFLQKQAEGVPSRPKKGARGAGGSGILRPPEPCTTNSSPPVER